MGVGAQWHCDEWKEGGPGIESMPPQFATSVGVSISWLRAFILGSSRISPEDGDIDAGCGKSSRVTEDAESRQGACTHSVKYNCSALQWILTKTVDKPRGCFLCRMTT